MRFDAIEVAAGEAGSFVANLSNNGFRGVSVTMPHKEAVIPALHELSSTAMVLRAVNCIVNDGGRLHGENTDGEGFLIGLRHDTGRTVAGQHVVIVGAGGAARAILYACAGAGASTVSVINRSADRSQEAAVLADVARVGDEADLHTADIVVNATPLGMAGTETFDQLPFDVECIRADAVVVDIVYDPLETPLLRAAREAGLEATGGLAMLAGQAAGQFRRWTGLEPSLDVMLKAAKRPPS